MKKPSERKILLRILTFCLATILIAGMIPAGAAFFWEKKDTSKEPAVSETSKKPAVSETSKEPAAKETSKDPAAKVTSKDPAVTETSKEPAAKEPSGIAKNGTAAKSPAKAAAAEPVIKTEQAVKGDNKAPVAQNLSFETYTNISIAGRLKAIDPEGDAFTFQIDKKPKLGEVTMEGKGFRYIPYQNKSGDDFFTFTAVDSNGNVSAPANVNITVKKRNLKATVTYADMDQNPAHYAAIRLAEEGIIIGEKIGSSYFLEPNRIVTRSEFVAMAVSAAHLEVPAAAINTGFDDDDSTEAWAKPYIAAALTAGFISGKIDANGNISFAGSKQITRAEAAVIINKLASLSDESTDVFYKDAAEIPAWAVQATANINAVDIMAGYTDGTMRPNGLVTRADAVQLLYNALNLKESKNKSSFVFWVK